jgi:hypothetical protein
VPCPRPPPRALLLVCETLRYDFLRPVHWNIGEIWLRIYLLRPSSVPCLVNPATKIFRRSSAPLRRWSFGVNRSFADFFFLSVERTDCSSIVPSFGQIELFIYSSIHPHGLCVRCLDDIKIIHVCGASPVLLLRIYSL